MNGTDRSDSSTSSSEPRHVTTVRAVNRYSFNERNLFITYAIATAVASLGVLIGFYALSSNGVSHDTSFSAVMATTRNPDLDNLTSGRSLGSAPLSEELKKTKLMFGLLPLRFGESVPRAGFGLEGEVLKITKRAACY